MKTEIALIGNPNSGKTTLYNKLTGKAEKVGNWSGVTVNAVYNPYKKDKSITIVDLPGCYSFNGEGEDEKCVREYLTNNSPNVIINVIDGLNLERSLYLTSLLTSLGIPMVIAVNMADDMKKSGIKLKIKSFEGVFNCPVVEISALKNIGVDNLVRVALKNNKIPSNIVKDIKSENIKQFLRQNINNFIEKKQPKIEKLTLKLDKILLGKFSAFPVFFLLIFLVYFISIKFGGELSSIVSQNIKNLSLNVKNALLKGGMALPFVSLLSEGVLKGIGSVLSYLPQIILLFILVGILEQSGYMSRISFILDRLFGLVNLSGKAVVPLVLSSGCTATGITACRAVESKCERERLIYISPFIPCSAKSVVFGWFSYNLFNKSALVATSLYFLGIFASIIYSVLSGKEDKKDSSFAFEIPYLRWPSFSTIFSVVKVKVKDFVFKAGTIILTISVVVWALSKTGFSGYVGDNVEKSFLFYIGNSIKFLFVPLGFGNWKACVALLSGVFAKEGVIETLQILSLNGSVFSNLGAVYSYLIFILLSPPCVASIFTAKKELNSLKKTLKLVGIEFLIGYCSSLTFYSIYKICCFNKLLIFVFVFVIILLIISLIFVNKRINNAKISKNKIRLYERSRV